MTIGINFCGRRILENFAGRNSQIWLKNAKPRKFLPAKVSSFKVAFFLDCGLLQPNLVNPVNKVPSIDNVYSLNKQKQGI